MVTQGLKPSLVLIACAALVLCCAGLSVAGPNAGGTLILHSNPMLVYSQGESYCGQSGLSSCEDALATLPFVSGAPVVFHAIAAFPEYSSPRLKGLVFGITYDSTFVLTDHRSCGDFELSEDYWPNPGTGTAVTFSEEARKKLADV
jgi:hypothetical protein